MIEQCSPCTESTWDEAEGWGHGCRGWGSGWGLGKGVRAPSQPWRRWTARAAAGRPPL